MSQSGEKNNTTPSPEESRPDACLAEHPGTKTEESNNGVFKDISLLDKLLTPLILLAMVGGVLLGVYVPNIQSSLQVATLNGVSAPIVIGLTVMMWPVLTKVQWEALPRIFSSSRLWIHILFSLLLNWVIGPLVMLGLAWATLPDLPAYREGVIMVGLARCIAMVMIWNQLARGNQEYCATLVLINSILQVVMYSPYALLFINVIGGLDDVKLAYGNVAISVLIYLGIPLAAGVLTRYTMMKTFERTKFERKFLPLFSPLALLGLLFTIVVIFAYQGERIVHNLGPTFRVIVPLILYFVTMWMVVFVIFLWLARKKRTKLFDYEMAVVQSFTAGSNNFELAIAVCIATWGVESEQALAATIGPLVEVPVLLSLTWVALYSRKWFNCNERNDPANSLA